MYKFEEFEEPYESYIEECKKYNETPLDKEQFMLFCKQLGQMLFIEERNRIKDGANPLTLDINKMALYLQRRITGTRHRC